MKFFWPKYPVFLKFLYPQRISRINKASSIYLTFDDGPVPEVTPWVLDELRKFNARATFFCIGENIERHSEIFKRIIQEGHSIGNHTYNHLDGWKTSAQDYLENIKVTEQTMTVNGYALKKEKEMTNPELPTNNSGLQTPNFSLFRPPYGKIKNSQAGLLKKEGYKIVMWDVISGDYDKDYSAEVCYRNVINNAMAGSIIVFHDSIKAFENLKEILPQILKYYKEKGFEFRSIKDVPSANL